MLLAIETKLLGIVANGELKILLIRDYTCQNFFDSVRIIVDSIDK
jgi:hypothetical protein